MIFLQPEYLNLFLFLPVLLAFWLFYFLTKHNTRQRLGSTAFLRKSSHLQPMWRDCARYLLLNLALAAVVLALAQPQLIRETQVPQPEKMDLVFLLDTSPSMRAEDVPPSRLERALDIIGRYAASKPPQDRIALVSFASSSLVLSYLTEDSANILYYLNYLKEDSSFNPGTDIGGAVHSGLAIISRDAELYPKFARQKKVFILISDGEDHGAELEASVKATARQGIKIHTIGIGSLEGAPIPIPQENGSKQYVEDAKGNRIVSRFDERTLRWIAEATGGAAHRSLTGQELDGFFHGIMKQERKIEGFRKVVEYKDLYRLFLIAAFGLLCIRLLV